MKSSLFTSMLSMGLLACSAAPKAEVSNQKTARMEETSENTLDTITLGAGCFWCTEAIFSGMKGVVSALPGYSGGQIKNPSYREVCSGRTGHAEVVQVVFDPTEVALKDILGVFFQTHDPTTLNRQGADVGTQYRSAIFYHSEGQAALARALVADLDASGAFGAPIVTEITTFGAFYKAEQEHLDYYARNPEQSYCRIVIQPKMEKFRKVFPALVK